MSVFSSDSKFIRFLNGVFDEVALNLLFILCCLPIVTIGASASALITAHRRVLYSHATCVSAFFKAFRRSCRRMIPAWLILLVLMVLFGYSAYFGTMHEMETRYVSFVALGFTACLSAIMFQFDSQFECSLGRLLFNSVLLFFTSPVRSVLVGAFTWGPVLLLLFFGPQTVLQLSFFIVLFYFSLIAALNAWILKMPFQIIMQNADAQFITMEEEDAFEQGVDPNEEA